MARIIETGIRGKIDRMIRKDLHEVISKNINKYSLEDIVWEYRDKFFPSGHYDYVFEGEAKNTKLCHCSKP